MKYQCKYNAQKDMVFEGLARIILMDFIKIQCQGVDWINAAQDRDQRQGIVES